jgi:hypothetical protein
MTALLLNRNENLEHHDITKILLKVALTTIEKTQLQCINFVLNPYFDSGAVNICQQWHEL